MKTTGKKIVGCLLAGMLIASIGAVFVAAQTDETSDNTTPKIPFGSRHGMNGLGPLTSDLTEEQQAEIEELTTTLRDENATPQEIRAAIQEKLDEFGVLDTQLDTEIAQTEQRLTILNREKELRTQGYNWTDIQQVIQDEFNLQNTTGISQDMMFGQGFERGPCGGPRSFISSEESDQ